MTKDPYLVWISEIILQQTRIEQGLDYYHRITGRFSDIRELASAKEEELLKLWQGLGYYSRARNMHAAAREIMEHHNGIFPNDFHEILKLKGIGPYTAAAIASFSFNLPYPVVDGNVLRFFSRFFGIRTEITSAKAKKTIYQKALEIMDYNDPGTFNQAIMEFGALQCKPGIPDCKKCPFRTKCFAYIHKETGQLPLRSKPSKLKKRYFNYLVIIQTEDEKNRYFYLRKRISADIWKNLYDFPLVESGRPVSKEKLMASGTCRNIIGTQEFIIRGRSRVYKHILSHQVIYARFYSIEVPLPLNGPFIRIKREDLFKYPVPRLIESFLLDKQLGI